ncbi:MAG: hypothetical protein RLZZ221_1390 [Verrucomicrobiota bacterium]
MNCTDPSCGCAPAPASSAAGGVSVSALKSALAAAPELPLTVIWTDGEPIVDCGGTVRRTVTCLLQTWVGPDTDHRITAGKLLKAFAHAGPVLGDEDLPVELEYETCNVVQLTLAEIRREPGRFVLQLGSKHTDCLAKELCLPGGAGEDRCC